MQLLNCLQMPIDCESAEAEKEALMNLKRRFYSITYHQRHRQEKKRVR
jgi:hypothetical protein